MELKEVSLDYIIDYCEKHKKVDWLKNIASTEVAPNKNGKERKISFIEIRNAFVREFMPEIAPSAKPKKPSMYERIANL